MASITIDLAPDIVQRLQVEADRQGLDLGRMLADAAVALLGRQDVPMTADRSETIAQMSDEQVLALCDAMLSVDEQARLSELLGRHGEGELGEAEVGELDGLMQVYRTGLVRKAEAWKVAVERGLRVGLARQGDDGKFHDMIYPLGGRDSANRFNP
jgi:hypothetical protein